MCGRASLTKSPKQVEKHFGAVFVPEELEKFSSLPNYNVAPTHLMPIVTASQQARLQFFRWGITPPWAKGSSQLVINARVETLLDKKLFQKALELKQRCLIPMDGFYEWQVDGKQRIPYRITLSDESLFSVAGLWTEHVNAANETVKSYTVITQPPNKLMAGIHNRMPAILTKEQEKAWLDTSVAQEELLNMISPLEDDSMKAYQVSNAIGNVRNNHEGLIKPLEEDEKRGIQGSLFE